MTGTTDQDGLPSGGGVGGQAGTHLTVYVLGGSDGTERRAVTPEVITPGLVRLEGEEGEPLTVRGRRIEHRVSPVCYGGTIHLLNPIACGGWNGKYGLGNGGRQVLDGG